MVKITPRLTDFEIEHRLKQAIAAGWIRNEDTAVIFYDLDFLKERILHVCSCFPENALHGLAIKANPLYRILNFAREVSPQAGVEAASSGEVNLALRAGFSPDRIVFDSPVKTMDDLAFAINAGVRLNVDNLDELSRIATLSGPASIGLRINPQVGVGKILESSVAGNYSKFGVPINYKRKELENAFLTYPWLTGVHLHVGSQGCSLDLLTEGIGILYDFVNILNLNRFCI